MHPERGAEGKGRGPAVSQTYFRVEKPSIMLVRIEPGEEPQELGLDQLWVDVLRVRHPIPAYQRMDIRRPLVVVIGESVRPADRALLVTQARRIRAAVLQIGPLLHRESLAEWMETAMRQAFDQRAEAGEHEEEPRTAAAAG